MQVLRGGEVLVSGDAVVWLASACQLASRVHRGNGVDRPTRFDELRQTFARAAQMLSNEPAPEPSEVATTSQAMADPITAGQAAVLLRTTPQNVTGLCRRQSLSTSSRVGGRWLIERAEVLERARRRAA